MGGENEQLMSLRELKLADWESGPATLEDSQLVLGHGGQDYQEDGLHGPGTVLRDSGYWHSHDGGLPGQS